MKCILTGTETKSLTKNFPLSREGREVLDSKLSEYNSILKDKFIERVQVKNKETGSIDVLEQLEKLAPKLSKTQFLKLVSHETLDGAFSKLENHGKEKNDVK